MRRHRIIRRRRTSEENVGLFSNTAQECTFKWSNDSQSVHKKQSKPSTPKDDKNGPAQEILREIRRKQLQANITCETSRKRLVFNSEDASYEGKEKVYFEKEGQPSANPEDEQQRD